MTATKGSDGTTSATKGKAAREAACAFVRQLALGTLCSATEGRRHGTTCDTLTAILESRSAIHEEELREGRELLARVQPGACICHLCEANETCWFCVRDAFLGASQQTAMPPADDLSDESRRLLLEGIKTAKDGRIRPVPAGVASPAPPLAGKTARRLEDLGTTTFVNDEGQLIRNPTAVNVVSGTAETCGTCRGKGKVPTDFPAMPCPDCRGSGTTKGEPR